MAGQQPPGRPPQARSPRPGEAQPQQPYGEAQITWDAPLSAPQERSLGLCILLYFVTFGIYSLFWWYAIHSENASRRNVDPSPGMAVGMMFVPFFNLYWVFHIYLSMSDRLNLIARDQLGDQTPPVSKGLALAGIICIMAGYPLLFLFIGVLVIPVGIVLILIWWVGVQGTANRIAQAARAQGQQA